MGGAFTAEGSQHLLLRFVGILWAEGPAWPFLSLLQHLGFPHPFAGAFLKCAERSISVF